MVDEKDRTKKRKGSTKKSIYFPFECPVCIFLNPLTFRPAKLAFRNYVTKTITLPYVRFPGLFVFFLFFFLRTRYNVTFYIPVTVGHFRNLTFQVSYSLVVFFSILHYVLFVFLVQGLKLFFLCFSVTFIAFGLPTLSSRRSNQCVRNYDYIVDCSD